MLEELEEDDDTTEKAIWLINCGVTENLYDLFELKTNIRVFVLDSHRPVHHKNLTELNPNVFVFLDEEEGEFTEKDLQDMFTDDEGKQEEERQLSCSCSCCCCSL